ncbi:MAG: hypothetical protein Q8O74_04895, partial [bacterium]|nr:hypothetical protein [bacterium]
MKEHENYSLSSGLKSPALCGAFYDPLVDRRQVSMLMCIVPEEPNPDKPEPKGLLMFFFFFVPPKRKRTK